MAFCKNTWAKIKRLLSKVDDFLLRNIDIAIDTVNSIKSVMDSGFVRGLIELTPTNLDDKLVAKAAYALELSLKELHIIKDKYNQSELRDFLEWLKTQPESVRDTYFSKIGSLMAKNLDGAKMKQVIYDTFVQARYVEKKDDTIFELVK